MQPDPSPSAATPMAGHTPGPWWLDGENVIRGNGQQRIADLWHIDRLANGRLIAQVPALAARVTELEAALRFAHDELQATEWAGSAESPYDFTGGDRHPFCPSCSGWKPRAGVDYTHGHRPGCSLDATLSAARRVLSLTLPPSQAPDATGGGSHGV